MLLNLSPSVLEEFGYTRAVEGLINKINETKQIHFILVLFGMHQRLKKEHELALYRITQELINNVLKHADAKNVSLQIGNRDNKIILMIEDDGKGFDTTAHMDCYGLHNLNARTKLLQGTMTIDSLFSNDTGVQNIAFGESSLYSNTSGNVNLTIGQSSLYHNTTGAFNSGLGFETLFSNLLQYSLGSVPLHYILHHFSRIQSTRYQ